MVSARTWVARAPAFVSGFRGYGESLTSRGRKELAPAGARQRGTPGASLFLKKRNEVPVIHDRSILTRFLIVILFLGGGAMRPAAAQQQIKTSPPQAGATPTTGVSPQSVSTEQAQYLVRSALLTLNDANRSGNYTVLRDLAAPDFQARNTAADLAQSFADLRRRNFDLFAAAILAPQFTTPPGLDGSGRMRLTGFFPTQPLQIRFDVVFQSVGGQWRLFAISVSTPEVGAPHALLQPGEQPQDTKIRHGILKDIWYRALARPSVLTLGKTF
jgi:hypothetical protein